MRVLLCVLVVTSGCATWKDNLNKTLAYSSEAAQIAHTISSNILGDLCLSSAKACVANGVNKENCEKYKACDAAREKIDHAIKSVHMLALSAKVAIIADDRPAADVAVQEVGLVLSSVRNDIDNLATLEADHD